MKKLIKKVRYSAEIELLSGLHIGGTNLAMGIGGPDKLVIRNPLDNKPYIPGSSIKGKMRSLFELSVGECSGGGVSRNPNSQSGMLFGTSADSNNSNPSRIIIRDATMTTNPEELTATDMYLTEAKTEASIDRITARANPRTNERVPKGVRFAFEAVLNVFEGDDEALLDSNIRKSIRLIENDYLGGNGSRGYGHVRFNKLTKQDVAL